MLPVIGCFLNMSGCNREQIMKLNRLSAEALSVIAELDKCVSKLHNAFLNGEDVRESRKTLARLKAESFRIRAETDDALNGQ